MNWGSWIVVSFILFAVFIGTLVTVCVRQNIGLVSRDYYKEELAYQEQIDRMNNTRELASKPLIMVTTDSIQVDFSQWSRVEEGEFELFSPSDSRQDRKIPFSSTARPTWGFALDGIPGGSYRAKLRWKMDGKEFYMEQVIFI